MWHPDCEPHLLAEQREGRMRVEEIMTSKPATCTPADTVERAAQLMEENDCGCIPVVDSRIRVISGLTAPSKAHRFR